MGSVARAISAGLSILALASCSVLGASLDSLSSNDAQAACSAGQDLSSNPNACGSCGNVCKSDEVCANGQCSASCLSTNDPQHCGDCTTACQPTEVCGDGRCRVGCPDGQTNCGGSCADFQTDSKHCGNCDTACGPTDECVDGKCVIACKQQLIEPMTDPWGWSWDRNERAKSKFSDAVNTCTQFRGRLPTVSELYRVSATQSATVGQTLHTNLLWSADPVAPNHHARLKLSDASIAIGDGDDVATNYRCVCPPTPPKVYVGSNCYGAPKTNACGTLDGEGKLHNIDTKDRPAIPKSAAVWECALYGGHLATPVQLTEAIQQNISGLGSGGWLHTADDARYDRSTVLNWTDGTNFVFAGAADGKNALGFLAPTDSLPFRCVGENTAPPATPLVTTQWWSAGRRRIESADLPAATMIEAVDHCFQSGGHLPTMAELHEVIAQGAPGGSGTAVWTSDQMGWDNKNYTVGVTKWTGTDTAHLYGGENMSWSYKTPDVKLPYRCVYYPVDATYGGPSAESCAGGCMTIAPPGSSGAKSWFDSVDRDVHTVTAAIDVCQKVGGHLASERDLTEGIRGGLPNGTGKFLHTSDSMLGWCGTNNGGTCSFGGGGCGNFGGACGLFGWGRCNANPTCPVDIYVGTVKWSGTMPGFDDLWENNDNRRMEWSAASQEKPFRCMWTNELR